MKRYIGYLLAVVSMIVLLAGCKGSEGKAQAGPEDVLKEFNRAITAGDFTKAYTLCDSTTMSDYIESYREAWETLQKQDSSALAIASSILSGAVIEITASQKEDEGRTLSYTLEADGHSKTRKASMIREEGEWKVEKITDAH